MVDNAERELTARARSLKVSLEGTGYVYIPERYEMEE
jgi:hypothetical protein